MLDLGNVLEPYTGEKINQAKQEAFIKTSALLNCRAIGVGPLDIAGEHPFLNRAPLSSLPPMVAANLEGPTGMASKIKKYVIITVNDIKFGITGVIPDLSTKKVINSDYRVSDPEMALKQVLPELKKKSDFILLLSQFRAQETEQLIEPLASVDIALCIGAYLVDLGKPSDLKVMNVVKHAQQLGIITIEKKEEKITVKDADRISLSPEIPSDPKADGLVSVATEKINKEKRAQRAKIKRDKRGAKAMEQLKMTPEEFIKSYSKPTELSK